MSSPYIDLRQDNLHYIDWSEHNNNPKWLGLEDYECIKRSGKIFARKIADEDLLDTLDEYINHFLPD